MSQQLSLSSLFCIAALAGLCVVTSVRDLAGADRMGASAGLRPPAMTMQAELSSGLLAD
jgi:hypothetical protein